MAIASSNGSLSAFEKRVPPGFRKQPSACRKECGNGRVDPLHRQYLLQGTGGKPQCRQRGPTWSLVLERDSQYKKNQRIMFSVRLLSLRV